MEDNSSEEKDSENVEIKSDENENHEEKESTVEKRKEAMKDKVSHWFKDHYNLMLFGVLILAFVVRVYYFILTKNQPLWWDEVSYGSLAKNLAFGLFENADALIGEKVIRPLFLPLLWSLLFKIGIGEIGARLLFEFIPSIISVFLIYLVVKEAYDKKIALISAFVLAISWMHIFYSMRLLTSVPALFLLLISVYFFIKSENENFNSKYFGIAIFFLSLSFLMRYIFNSLGFVYAAYILLLRRKYLLKKEFWIAGIIGVVPLIAFFLINYFTSGSFYPAFGVYTASFAQKPGPAWYTIGFLTHILRNPLIVLFTIGILYALFNLVIGYGLIRNKKYLRSNLLLLLLILVPLYFFIFVVRASEDRYLFIFFLSIAVFISQAIFLIYDFTKKYNKQLAVVVLLVILLFSGYAQLKFADSLIKGKKDSYAQMKEAFLWIEENSQEGESVMASYTELYSFYYGNRIAYGYPANETLFLEEIDEKKPDYFIVHAFNSFPQYILEFPEKHSDRFTPVKFYTFDGTNPILVIYKVNYPQDSINQTLF